jgi:hypothetical protein
MPESEHLTVVRDDTTALLSQYFAPGEVSIAAEDAVTGDGRTAIPWTFTGIDSIGVDGLAPTGRQVTVRGMTIFYVETKEFIRSIDWLDAFVQLGYSLRNGRTVIRTGVD